MLLSSLLMPLFAAQVVFEPIPVPPPPPPLGSPWWQQMDDSYRRTLAANCMSAAGVEIVLAGMQRQRIASASKSEEWRRNHEDVAQAAWAEPFDAEAFARAIRAEAALRAEREIAIAEDNLAVIAALSGQDRAIFAQRMTTEVRQGYVKPC